MAPKLSSALILVQGLALLGLLSGCAIAEGVGEIAQEIWDEDAPPAEKFSWKSRTNYYEPVILNSSKEMIRIQYLDVNSNAQPEQAIQLIIDHCDGSYVETNRVKTRGKTTIEAECTDETDS